MNPSRYGRAVTIAGVVATAVVFIGIRVALILVREPFFDELFTVWISQKSIGDVIAALRSDSGPPLYYLATHFMVTGAAAVAQVYSVRFFSLVLGFGSLAALWLARPLGEARYVAAILLAFFPPHLYFSSEARPYALCALLIGGASLLLVSERPRDLWLAAGLIVAAAYTHYYAVLFFPVPLLIALYGGKRASIRRSAFATAAIGAAYIPGFLLAVRQPGEAIEWMHPWPPLEIALSAIRHLGFAAPFPTRFLATPPGWLQWTSAALVAIVLGWGLRRSARARVFGLMVLIPLAGSIALAVLGRPVYFPMRFESVLAVPVVAMLALSMGELPRRARAVVLAAFVALGGWVCYRATTDRALWRPDAYRETAEFARSEIGAQTTLVASGPQYLELVGQRDPKWNPRVVPFPSSQGLHPGWRAEEPRAVLDAERERLTAQFGPSLVWVGDYGSDEMISLTRVFGSTVLFRRAQVIMLLMSPDRVEEKQQKHHPQTEHKEDADLRPGR